MIVMYATMAWGWRYKLHARLGLFVRKKVISNSRNCQQSLYSHKTKQPRRPSTANIFSSVLQCISQPVTFLSIKLMCRTQELTVVEHQPTYLLINVGDGTVLHAQLCQLQHQQYYDGTSVTTQWLTSHKHIIGHIGDNFTRQMTQPTVSEHWRTIVDQYIR